MFAHAFTKENAENTFWLEAFDKAFSFERNKMITNIQLTVMYNISSIW